MSVQETARMGLEGRRLGRYHLRHKLAEGGMATVYLAQVAGERGFARWMAVKVAQTDGEIDPELETMLADEARLMARVHHPHVCSVVDFGKHEGVLYMVMEYLHGESLAHAARRSWREEKTFPAWLTARAIADAARGLHAAHELTDAHHNPLGLVHRDVSPENILIGYDGPSKVLDFGVVSGRGRETKTRDGEVKGKLSHMAPEQLLGKQVDRRADVWGLGVVLWEATLGRRLFRAETHTATIENVIGEPIPRPSEVTEHYPQSLERIVMKALERDPDARTESALKLALQLELYLHSLGRPAGHGEVSVWMRSKFSDRLLVRDALLTAPEDSGPTSLDDLARGDASSSQLMKGRISKNSFAPPPRSDPSMEITRVGTPAAKRERDQSQRIELERGLDEKLAELRRQGERRTVMVWVLAVALLLLGAALVFQLTL